MVNGRINSLIGKAVATVGTLLNRTRLSKVAQLVRPKDQRVAIRPHGQTVIGMYEIMAGLKENTRTPRV